ncbi:MAG: hypothetical protein IJA36_07650 [Lachnospiraceae bacterium]|nr:hypothetical protein [Lachnospiraceae bacterium]
MKKKIVIFVVFMLVACLLACGNNTINSNAESFGNNVRKIESTQVELGDLTEFEWDYLYTFSPYTPKETIEDVVGFESKDIRGNIVSEGTVYLLFVKDNKVVANVCSSVDSLGYHISFGSYDKYLCIESSKKAVFSVETEDNVKYLEYVQDEVY